MEVDGALNMAMSLEPTGREPRTEMNEGQVMLLSLDTYVSRRAKAEQNNRRSIRSTNANIAANITLSVTMLSQV